VETFPQREEGGGYVSTGHDYPIAEGRVQRGPPTLIG
jgi:hypothetical protein